MTARASAAHAVPAAGLGGRDAIETTVTGLGYELVDVERAARGLLRVTIDRVPGRRYASGDGDSVTVDDCEAVTRQLQYALEVEGLAYERLEVSSPGLDRPLKKHADYERFAGQAVALTLKQPFAGRKSFRGVLGSEGGAQAGQAGGDPRWTLTFDEGKGPQQLVFTIGEVREARLVPVVDFKGRRGKAASAAPAAAGPGAHDGEDR